ncbi:GP132 protein, partial [Polypterus senegalus]|nr:probable G-protein coupled receptor 132b [Polypterus senegalus]XP_039597811.1 probable G-protein coupled receptor 132b [Polypterus senegalus]MBN3291579.1 GP132 protein [Polypterus senegalus]
MVENTSNCSLPYEKDKIPLMTVYTIAIIIGVPANLITIVLTFQQVQRKNVLGIYLLSLSLCDMMYLCTLPLWLVYVYYEHFWIWSDMACKITGYVFFNNMYISIFLLCCISADRYWAVAYSLESRGIRQQKLAGLITCFICIAVAIIHSPVFIMDEGKTNENHHKCFEPRNSTAKVAGFNYARVCVGFLIPLGILIYTNRGILANIQASSGLQKHQKLKIKYLARAVIILFLVCFAPYHIILLLRAVMFHVLGNGNDSCNFERTIYLPYTCFLGLSTINSALNPILYVLASDNIRKELRRGLSSIRSRTSSQHRVTDSSLPKQHCSKNSLDTTPSRENNSS